MHVLWSADLIGKHILVNEMDGCILFKIIPCFGVELIAKSDVPEHLFFFSSTSYYWCPQYVSFSLCMALLGDAN